MKKNYYLPALIFFLSFNVQSVLGQPDPCVVKNEFDRDTAKLREATQAFDKATTDVNGNKIARPTKPVGSKATLEQELKTAKKASDLSEQTNKDNEYELGQANEAVIEFTNDPQKGRKMATLKGEISILEGKIKKAQDADAKVSKQDRTDLINFKQSEIDPLENAIKTQMPGLSLEAAKANVDVFKEFKNSKIDEINKEIEKQNGEISAIEDKFRLEPETVTLGDNKKKEEAQEVIKRKTSELNTAIEKCRNDVIANIKSLHQKQNQYTKMEEKLYPDQKTRELIDNLPKMSNELSAKKLEEKTLLEEQKKLQNSAKSAKEKVEGGTKDGKSFAGSEKAYKDDQEKVKAIEGNLTKLKNYEIDNEKWEIAEKPKTDAEQKVKKARPDYNQVVIAKNAALAGAQAAAQLNTLDARLATRNTVLARQISKDAQENNARVEERKKKYEKDLETAKNAEQRNIVTREWAIWFRSFCDPHYIRLRNKAEVDRLQAIIDDATLQRFNCFDDVKEFIQLLSKTQSQVMERNASLVSDMDSGIPTGADKLGDLIPVPPLIEQLSGACRLEGSWTQDTPGVGSTVWQIKSDGTANEIGIGYAKGKAKLSGNVLHIDWQTNTGYSGYYEWTLDGNCKSGKGTLAFKTGRTDSLNSTVKRN